MAPLKSRQPFNAASVAAQVLNPSWNWILAASEQGELMALSLQTSNQWLADEAGSTHDQDLHNSPRHNGNPLKRGAAGWLFDGCLPWRSFPLSICWTVPASACIKVITTR